MHFCHCAFLVTLNEWCMIKMCGNHMIPDPIKIALLYFFAIKSRL